MKTNNNSTVSIWIFFVLLLGIVFPLSGTMEIYHAPNKKQTMFHAKFISEYPFKEEDDLLMVDFINIKLGDAILVRSGGKIMLIDGGVTRQTPLLQAFLERNNILHIDYFFTTHEHDDHIQAMTNLMKLGMLPDVFMSPNPPDHAGKYHLAAVEVVRENNVSFHQLKNLEKMSMGKAELTFFRDERVGPEQSINHRSMMLNIRFGERNILLTADVTGESLSYLREKYPELVRAEVLKSPHHGLNRLRNDVYQYFAPEVVAVTNIVSGGRNLGEQLEKRKIPHYFISYGTVHFETDGNIWYVRQENQ